MTLFLKFTEIFLIKKTFKTHKDFILVSFLNTTNILCLLSSFCINSKIIINERNDIFNQKLNFSWKILKFLTYSFAKQITTNNKSNLEFLKLKYGNKAHYLPNPVND